MRSPPLRSSPLGFIKKAVPLTSRGVFLLSLSVLILGLGVWRADMAGLFWGSSFLLASLYAVVGNHLTRLFVSRGKGAPGFLEVHLPVSVLSPGEEAEAHIGVTLARILMPGFTVRFTLPLHWHERSVSGVRSPLAPGKNRHSIRFRAEKRGSYSANEALFEVRDILGFSSGAFSVSVRESVKVFPRVAPRRDPLRVVQEGGDAVRYAAQRRRSEELLEVRKYFPGDDVRKLNWKVFAHSSELFLRIGEETPPPESRFLIILDSTANPLVPRGMAADYLDGVVEECATTMTILLSRGTEALFWRPGSAQCRPFTQESATELMAILADVWWAEPGWAMELPARTGMHALVFSTPGSPSLDRIMREVAGRGWRASLFLKDLDCAPQGAGRVRVRDLIFVSPAGSAPARGQAYNARSLRPFRDAMAEAVARYGGSLAGAAPPRTERTRP